MQNRSFIELQKLFNQALSQSVQKGSEFILEVLNKINDPNLSEKDRFAIVQECFCLSMVNDQENVALIILEKHADLLDIIFDENDKQQTLFYCAVDKSHFDLSFKMFDIMLSYRKQDLKKYAVLFKADVDGLTPLHLLGKKNVNELTYHQQTKYYDFLLQFFDELSSAPTVYEMLNSPDKAGNTSLHYFAQNRSITPQNMSSFINTGGRLDLYNNEGKTTYQLLITKTKEFVEHVFSHLNPESQNLFKELSTPSIDPKDYSENDLFSVMSSDRYFLSTIKKAIAEKKDFVKNLVHPANVWVT